MIDVQYEQVHKYGDNKVECQGCGEIGAPCIITVTFMPERSAVNENLVSKTVFVLCAKCKEKLKVLWDQALRGY